MGEWPLLKEAISIIGVERIDEKVKKAQAYAEMLKKRREWAGLTSKTLAAKLDGAMAQSACVAAEIKGEPGEILDIGAGGGILGVVLAVVMEEWRVTLAESSSRKAAFLAEVKSACGLRNVSVLNVRAEEISGGPGYDFCVSRAAGTIRELAPLALALLKPRGTYLALKSSDPGAELEEAEGTLSTAGGRLVGVVRAQRGTLENPLRGGSIVVVEKM
jgi:16S rRNA (guanine527-N7)-methyltransferase